MLTTVFNYYLMTFRYNRKILYKKFLYTDFDSSFDPIQSLEFEDDDQ